MFSSGPNYNKLKTNLRLTINRLKLLEKKKTEMALKSRKEIADYIQAGKIERAKIRVETIIREDYLVEAMELIEMFCDLLIARFGLLQQMKTLDDGLAEAISSIIWVSPRLQSDVQELKVIETQLAAKYGKPYALACRENGVGTVSQKLMHKMSVQAPPKLTVEKYLIEIAKYYNVEYEPDTQVLAQDEVFIADNLVDLGPAPPLPDKAALAAADHQTTQQQPQPPPFQYPTQQPGGAAAAAPAPFQYPPQQPNLPYPGGANGFTAAGQQQPHLPKPPQQSVGDSIYEDGPPPYFPPDVQQGSQAQQQVNRTVSQEDNTKRDPAAVLPVNDLDLPELPAVPTELGTPKGDDDDDDDIDFDDLTKRFEALKKKK